MNMFMELCLAALLAVTAENVIFTGGIGFSRVLRAARKPKTIALYSCFVGLFSLASALTACCARRFMRSVRRWPISWWLLS